MKSIKLDAFLAGLKIAGYVVAGVAAIYLVTHEIYITDAQGHRHPTTALKASICFTLLGLIISLNTAVLEVLIKRQVEQRAAQEKREAESKAMQEKQQADLEAAAKERRDS